MSQTWSLLIVSIIHPLWDTPNIFERPVILTFILTAKFNSLQKVHFVKSLEFLSFLLVTALVWHRIPLFWIGLISEFRSNQMQGIKKMKLGMIFRDFMLLKL